MVPIRAIANAARVAGACVAMLSECPAKDVGSYWGAPSLAATRPSSTASIRASRGNLLTFCMHWRPATSLGQYPAARGHSTLAA
jgi:hypothetical protein